MELPRRSVPSRLLLEDEIAIVEEATRANRA